MAIDVSIIISDPWDLGEALAWQPLVGTVVQVVDDDHGGRGLIRLSTPIEYGGRFYECLIASPRHEGARLVDLRVGKEITCALIDVDAQQVASSEALDTSKWRGSLGFIGTLQP